jgi:hypothetical protein
MTHLLLAFAALRPTSLRRPKQVSSLRKAMVRLIFQPTYDLFYDAEGIWPTLADLQQTLDRRGYGNVVAVRIVQQIDAALLKPLDFSNGHPPPTDRLILTAAAIKRCTNSGEDIANLLAAVRWLGRRMEQFHAPADQRERGMRFTAQQLAEAVPLDLNSAALRRLVEILQAEGWIHDDYAI